MYYFIFYQKDHKARHNKKGIIFQYLQKLSWVEE